jgi:hypothetical protein
MKCQNDVQQDMSLVDIDIKGDGIFDGTLLRITKTFKCPACGLIGVENSNVRIVGK